MSQRANKRKAEYLASLSDKTGTLKESAKNIVFNFKFFCFGKTGGQSFSEWEREKILSDLNNKLKDFSCKTVEELRTDGTLELYDDYPKGSIFKCPAILTDMDIIWSRLRLTGRRRLIGFFSQQETQQRKIFYVVFLDKNHEFAPSSKN